MSDFWDKDTYYNRISYWLHVDCCLDEDSGHHNGIPCVHCGKEPKKTPWSFPLCPPEGEMPTWPDAPGQFGAPRKHDFHTGIDLYCEAGDKVAAVESGKVVAIEAFTGPDAESPWWNETWAVLIEGASGVAVYGEIQPGVKVGDTVKQYETIGFVAPVLKTFKGRPMVMLHLELMTAGSTETVWWKKGDPKPECLLDPSDLLPNDRYIAFDLSAYDGKRYRV